MSQIYRIVQAGGAAGPILTLTGNSGGPVGPTAGNINVLGDNSTGINITGAGSTLTVTNAGGQVDTAQTVDGSTINLGAGFTIANNEIAIIQSRIIGAYETATNEAFGCILTTTVRKQGAAAVALVQAFEQTALARSVGVPGTVDAIYDTAAAVVRIRVTGEAGHTINWKSVSTILRQAAP